MSGVETLASDRPASQTEDRSAPYLQYADDFLRDGVVVIRQAISEEHMALMDAIFARHFAHALDNNAVGLEKVYPGDKSPIHFYTANSLDDPMYATLMRDSAIADVASGVFGGRGVWYWADQLWNKGGGARRTPWHQDSSYIPYDGDGLANLWIPLSNLSSDAVLEVVRKSHRGTLYNGMTYNPDDDTAPLYEEKDLPRLPRIEDEREKWNILSTDMKRGDILMFHPSCLHGGAPTKPDQLRQCFTFRLFSDDAIYRPLPHIAGDDRQIRQRKDTEGAIIMRGFNELRPGQRMSESSGFRQVRPWAA